MVSLLEKAIKSGYLLMPGEGKQALTTMWNVVVHGMVHINGRKVLYSRLRN